MPDAGVEAAACASLNSDFAAWVTVNNQCARDEDCVLLGEGDCTPHVFLGQCYGNGINRASFEQGGWSPLWDTLNACAAYGFSWSAFDCGRGCLYCGADGRCHVVGAYCPRDGGYDCQPDDLDAGKCGC
ncbi:MAG: hypothetical protein HY906_01305 [Deltaproteobacteria bacterium]|nr:hypothetical protein [Deltaproteobacteria bacterium]